MITSKSESKECSLMLLRTETLVSSSLPSSSLHQFRYVIIIIVDVVIVSISVGIIETLPSKLSSLQLQVQTTLVCESLRQNSLALDALKKDLVRILLRNR